MKRVLIILVLAVGTVIGVTAYNRQRGSDAIKGQMLRIVAGLDCSKADRRYLTDLVERMHPEVVKPLLSADGRRLDEAGYIEKMFNRFISSAKSDGKPAELIMHLEASRDAHVAANRGD